ncbi:G-protein coupled receptor GRL101-like [Amphiura filiformis]|uniref:G-protein coupled receptor GRL101-like n=1 Tax=Amphiura filiformis TaxID=82378 RepID=UPI003B21F689
MEEVCDGQIGCPGGDDETLCHLKRCPQECNCNYQGNNLQVDCTNGWNTATIENMARTSNTLKLTGGLISKVELGLFKGLSALHTLSLEGNNVGHLEQGAFDGLANLTWLDLSHNNISALTSHVFEGLPQLKELYLSGVPISTIQTDAFLGNTALEILVLIRDSERDTPVDVDNGGFRGLSHLKMLYVDDRFLCCHFDSLDECVTLEPQPPLFMCGSLMQNFVLRVSMWVLGISALIGNVYVVAVRIREKTKTANQAKQTFLVGNLAVSDCQMGIYMLILASVDLYYGDEYFIYSDQWRSSKLCKFASFLSLLSSEASVFFITLISLDRFICIVFPFGQIKLRGKSTKIAAAIIWAIAFVLGVVPTLKAGPESDFYDLSDVCIGLPLITRPSSYSIQSSDVGGPDSGRSFDLPVPAEFKPAWYFSIAIFLGINLVCFLAIFVCYIGMFIYVKMSRMQVQQSAAARDDIKIAIKMAAIVGTDFICWMPVIIMGILSQTGAAVIPLQMYTWSVVFILPINSSLNPYLYTIASMIGDARKSSDKKARSSSKSDNKSTSHTDMKSETNK